MAKKELHPIAKMAGYSSNEAFYRDFPDEQSFQKHMQMGGGAPMGGGVNSANYQGHTELTPNGEVNRKTEGVPPQGASGSLYPTASGNRPKQLPTTIPQMSVTSSFNNMPPMRMPQAAAPNNGDWQGAPLKMVDFLLINLGITGMVVRW